MESFRDGSRMDSSSKETLASMQQSTSNNYNGSCAISSFNILSLGNLDEHLSSGMNNVHLLQDSSTIVGNEYLTLRRHWLQRQSVKVNRIVMVTLFISLPLHFGSSCPYLWDQDWFWWHRPQLFLNSNIDDQIHKHLNASKNL